MGVVFYFLSGHDRNVICYLPQEKEEYVPLVVKNTPHIHCACVGLSIDIGKLFTTSHLECCAAVRIALQVHYQTTRTCVFKMY